MEQNDEITRKVLFRSAIPHSLIERILKFMGELNNEDKKQLFDVVYQSTYWTHLHKCFTGPRKGSFKRENANMCGKRWLEEELSLISSEGYNFVIALGKDVQGFVDKCLEKDIKRKLNFIYLPHPSPANVGKSSSWNPETKNREKIEERINNLLKLCRTISKTI